jgi:hypothetical protein
MRKLGKTWIDLGDYKHYAPIRIVNYQKFHVFHSIYIQQFTGQFSDLPLDKIGVSPE